MALKSTFVQNLIGKNKTAL